MDRITVIIPFLSNIDGLAVLMVLLQAQSLLPFEIIVIDNSPHQLAKLICYKYAINCPIRFYSLQKNIYESWNFGIKKSNPAHVLFMNDDIIIPLDFIEKLTTIYQIKQAYCYVPNGTPIDCRYKKGTLTQFNWKTKNNSLQIQQTNWMKGYCFFLPRKTFRKFGLFDTKYHIWYGDFDYQQRLIKSENISGVHKILQLNNTYVYHYGSMSYDLNTIGASIQHDEQYFNNKFYPITANSILQLIIKECHHK